MALVRSTLAAAALLAIPAGSRADEPAAAISGEQIYRVVCQACHMADAKGATGAAVIPALAGNRHLAAAGYVLAVTAFGKGAMPPMDDALTADQIVSVTNYIRTHFGNDYTDAVRVEDIPLGSDRDR